MRHDILIGGGGLIGMTLACALAGAGLRVAVVERERPARTRLPGYDGRASAIALGSQRVQSATGIWPDLIRHASPIRDIRVADGHPLRGVSPLFLHYDHREIGDEPFGWIIENRHIRRALAMRAKELPELDIIAPAEIAHIARDADAAQAVLKDGRCITADLAVAADGKFSGLRADAGIDVTAWNYRQLSMVCTIRHELPHDDVAVELFLPGGPFAMLPMTGRRTNIVWSEDRHLAEGFQAMSDADFCSEMHRRIGGRLGQITLAGPRFSYPLSLRHAARYVLPRFALIGDAAHAIHPIAGQGLNMGLRDVAVMAEILVDARRLGLDLGDMNVLRDYERRRRFDNVLLAAVTDGLTRLFSNDITPLRLARDIGLAGVQRLPPVKRFLMRHAMGMVGALPRLIRGEPL